MIKKDTHKSVVEQQSLLTVEFPYPSQRHSPTIITLNQKHVPRQVICFCDKETVSDLRNYEAGFNCISYRPYVKLEFLIFTKKEPKNVPHHAMEWIIFAGSTYKTFNFHMWQVAKQVVVQSVSFQSL